MRTYAALLIWCCMSMFSYAQSSKADNALLLDYYQTQQFKEAAAYLKNVYPEPVTDQKALSQLAYTSLMAGVLADAEKYYQRVYQADTNNLSVLMSLASINMRRGNITKADMYYRTVTTKDTTIFTVYKQLAAIRAQKADIFGYINYLAKANHLNPQEADVASDLSDQYVDLKQLSLAESVLNTAIDADPENIVLLQSLIKLTHAQKKWPATIKTGLQLMQAGDGSFITLSKLAQAYYFTKDYKCCIEVLATLSADQQNESSHYWTGMSYKNLHENFKAVTYLKKAIEGGISPSIATYYGEMAGSYQSLKLYKKAESSYLKAFQFEESPLLYYSLADLYDINLKNKLMALKYFKKYMASKPPAKQQAFTDYAKSRITALSNR